MRGIVQVVCVIVSIFICDQLVSIKTQLPGSHPPSPARTNKAGANNLRREIMSFHLICPRDTAPFLDHDADSAGTISPMPAVHSVVVS